MSKNQVRYDNFFGPKERKEQEDAVAAFLADGGKVTKLKENKGTSDYAFRKMERDGIDDTAGKTGGVALFGRVERNTVSTDEE
jgi:hypothetical protein